MNTTRTATLGLLALLTSLPGCDQSYDDPETSDVVSHDEDEDAEDEDAEDEDAEDPDRDDPTDSAGEDEDPEQDVPEPPRDHEGEPCENLDETVECSDDEHNVCAMFGTELRFGPCHTLQCEPGDTWLCGKLDGNGWCEVNDGVTESFCEDGTPLVLSFDGAEPTMMSATAAFDIGTGGMCIQSDWPTATTPWLALDRDGNGSIDGGHELFGSGTVMRDGTRASHGFLALGELDSNGDGRITIADDRWNELLLWSDVDGDKRSTFAEHQTLSTMGILSIELSWHDQIHCDARGNCGVERASFTFVGDGGTIDRGQVVDVHLSCQ